MNSIRKIAGRALFSLVFFGALVVFYIYTENVRHKQLENLTLDFIYEISKDGTLTETDYYMFLENVAVLESGISIELSHISYENTPHYELSNAVKTNMYFAERNILSHKVLPVFPIDYPEQSSYSYQLQDKTNANVLSSVSGAGYVPLPNEGVTGAIGYVAVCPSQRVYCGEKLCTVIRVLDGGVSYYMEADEVTVGFTGTGQYELTLDGVGTGAYVDIVSYPKKQMCGQGHETLLTPASIELFETTGEYASCEFCALEPLGITASVSSVVAGVGTALKDLPVSLYITYKDGHVEPLSLEDKRLYSSYDPSYCGTQTVRFAFLDYEAEAFTCTLQGGICVSCGDFCENRNLADYKRLPYCTTCMEHTPFFYGTTFVQTDYISNDEIITSLLNQKMYCFNRGDYVKVKLTYIGGDVSVPLYSLGKPVPIIEGEIIRTSGFRY